MKGPAAGIERQNVCVLKLSPKIRDEMEGRVDVRKNHGQKNSRLGENPWWRMRALALRGQRLLGTLHVCRPSVTTDQPVHLTLGAVCSH